MKNTNYFDEGEWKIEVNYSGYKYTYPIYNMRSILQEIFDLSDPDYFESIENECKKYKKDYEE